MAYTLFIFNSLNGFIKSIYIIFYIGLKNKGIYKLTLMDEKAQRRLRQNISKNCSCN